jgi:cell division protein FtsB
MAARKKKRRLRLGGPNARRWFAVGALVLVGLLYYRPLHDYFDARSQRAVRVAAVRKLQREQALLVRRLDHASSLGALAAEARTLGYIRPGEHLFIVKDIPQWRRRQHERHAARDAHRR